MNTDCIFNIILYSDIHHVTKIISLNSYTKTLLNTYLWQLLCERDYENLSNKINESSLIQKYIVCNCLNKFKSKFKLEISLEKLYNMEMLKFYYVKTQSSNPFTVESITHSKFQELVITYNQIIPIPNNLLKLQNLKHLYLDGNHLESVPAELGLLHNLKRLGLEHNNLTIIPKELSQLQNLEYLSLAYNQLISIPIELLQLSELKELNLLGNLLTIPTEFFQLPNLKVIRQSLIYTN